MTRIVNREVALGSNMMNPRLLMPQHLSAKPSEASHQVQAALEAVYSWSYSSERKGAAFML